MESGCKLDPRNYHPRLRRPVGSCCNIAIFLIDPGVGEKPTAVTLHKGPEKNQAAHRWDGLLWQNPPGRREKLIKTAESCSPSASGCWPVSSQPQYWSSGEFRRGGSWRDRPRSYSTRPAYPCRGRSDKSCSPERFSPPPDTESQSWPGAGSDRSCTPSCPPSRSRPRP